MIVYIPSWPFDEMVEMRFLTITLAPNPTPNGLEDFLE